jgi:glycosyltransferase involved in cell wall biosynthesis
MNRILIDLTDLELWSGHHGGTQRVVYGVAQHYFLQKKAGEEVVFMSFSTHDKAFHLSDFAPIYERVEGLRNQQQAEPTAAKAGPSLKSRLKQRVRPYVPDSVAANPTARKAAKQALVTARKAYVISKQVRRRTKARVAATSTPVIIFGADDTVLMLGKPWDNLDIQRTLTREREQHHFKLVQVAYDMIICLYPHLHHPSLFLPYTRHMFEAIAASDMLLAISESTARDLKRFSEEVDLNLPPVRVIRLGDELLGNTNDQGAKPDKRIQERFIACVGTIEIRKNHMLLYYTYKLAEERGITLPQLVIVGGRGWLSGDFQYLVEHDPRIQNKIIILDNISDSGLNWIYNKCTFTVYPSMYEGWGLPVAESLAYGKFCLASDSSSIPEIAGTLIDYFSPYDAQSCLRAIERYANTPTLLVSKQQEVGRVYKVTSWESTYNQVQEAIKKSA